MDQVQNGETIMLEDDIADGMTAHVQKPVSFTLNQNAKNFNDSQILDGTGIKLQKAVNDDGTVTYSATRMVSSGSGSSGSAADDFWDDVIRSIKNAKPGETVKANAGGITKMPWQVMEALRGNTGASLVITWNGGKDITIPAGKALSDDRGYIYYPLSYLAGLDFGAAAVQNPETGGMVEITAPVISEAPVVGSQPIEIIDGREQDILPGGAEAQLNQPAAAEETQSAGASRRAGNGLLAAAGLGLLAVLAVAITEIIRRKRSE